MLKFFFYHLKLVILFNTLCFLDLRNFIKYFIIIFLNKGLLNNCVLFFAAMIWFCYVLSPKPAIGNNIILLFLVWRKELALCLPVPGEEGPTGWIFSQKFPGKKI